MRKITFLLLFVSVVAFAQKKTINNYKYIIVPKQFDFLNKPDKYQTSSLTKFLFKKKGYTVFMSDEVFPKDLLRNRCLALTADVKDNSGMFSTKTVIELKECNNNIIFTTQEGKSKIKEYKRSYHEAIRGAFRSIQNLKYEYIPLPEDVISTNAAKEVVVVKQEKVTLPPVKAEVKKVVQKSSSDVLYAQPKPNGYQLVNTKPEVVYELLNTNIKDTYILKNKNGILYKNNNSWIAEYYKNGSKIVKAIEVKF